MTFSMTRRIINKGKSFFVSWWGERDYVHRSRFGISLVLNLQKDVDRYFFLDKFEDETLRVYRAIINPGDTVVDIGANIGIYSILGSRRVSPDGTIIAFEPSDWANERLHRNIRLNACQNIRVFKNAVSDVDGILSFHITEDDAYNSIGSAPMVPVRKIVEVEAVTLDAFLPSIGIHHVHVLKIDTEGADYLVLKGAVQLLRSDKAPVIFMEYNRNITEGYGFRLDDMYTLLTSLEYSIYEIVDWEPVLFDPSSSKSNEIICVKPQHEHLFRKAIHEAKTPS
ncbi:MAG: FkbM family methyltransferase [Bacteroidetes bacterium]|nr:FkbM family methyltransferase [Bacteroidota bacterium]